MAKTKVSEWSTTPSSNTDIDGINIAEGCAPSGINDAIRDMMAQIRSWQSGTYGDTFNGPVNGTVGATTPATGAFTTLSASSTVTLSGGTANGVTYLNGSKVLTSGSALTFDGTNFVNGSGGIRAGTNSGSGGSLIAWGGSTGATIEIKPSSVSGANGVTYDTSFISGGSGPHIFSIGGSEGMRLTSTGLGIGTSSPVTKLHAAADNTNPDLGQLIVSGATSTSKRLSIGFQTSGNYGFIQTLIAGDNYYPLVLQPTAGNVGLGVTPSAWTLPAFESTYGLYAGRGEVNITSNAYYNGGWKYIASGLAAQYRSNGGQHQWHTAPSGTAGNAITFTQAMTLDASGNLMVGTTSNSISSKVYIDGGSDNGLGIRIDSANSARPLSLWNAASSGNRMVVFYTGSGATNAGYIESSGSTTTYGTSSDYRLKNITGALTGYKERIMSLQPKQGTWKQDGAEFRGFLAHEFAVPYRASVSGEKDAVDENGNPVMQGMQASTSEVMADLVAYIQHLESRLTAAGL